MGLISRLLGGFSPAPAALPDKPKARAGFMNGGKGAAMAGWRPHLRSTQRDVAASWHVAAARAIDLLQNSGWIAGMIDQAAADTVGDGLKLKCRPENDVLGISEAEAQRLRNQIERRWETWSRTPMECDIEGKRSFGALQDAAFRSWFSTGEMLSESVFRRRPGRRYGTKVRLLPSYRLSNKTNPMERVHMGVKMDRDGLPVSYFARRQDEFGVQRDVEVRARDRLGRPKVIHIFHGLPQQVRGITPLVPALRVAKQFDQLSDSTLMQSLVRAVFAASITSESPTEEVLAGLLTTQEMMEANQSGISAYDAYLQSQEVFYEDKTIDVGVNGRVAHLAPGDKLDFHSSSMSHSDYEQFALHLLREIARCMGLTFESATGDYEKATYSSVRMATTAIFKITMQRRQFLVAPFCQAHYEAWLEEEIESGGINWPGGIEAFLANRAAACRADWVGTPKPQADDLKTAKAHQIYRDMGLVSDEWIAGEIGVDVEDEMAQQAREAELRESYDLAERVPSSGYALLASPEDEEDEVADAD
jgi:lambda family phage portal protein